MSYYTYILFSPGRNKYYIGHTGDILQERLRKHNSDHNGFTVGSGDWLMYISKPFQPKQKLIKESVKLKRGKVKKGLNC